MSLLKQFNISNVVNCYIYNWFLTDGRMTLVENFVRIFMIQISE